MKKLTLLELLKMSQKMEELRKQVHREVDHFFADAAENLSRGKPASFVYIFDIEDLEDER